MVDFAAHFTIHAIRKQLLGEKLDASKYKFLSKIKLRPPIGIEWSLNFR